MSRNPLWSESWFPTALPHADGVGRLQRRNPLWSESWFPTQLARRGDVVSPESQSSLERVLVSDTLDRGALSPLRVGGVAILFGASPGFRRGAKEEVEPSLRQCRNPLWSESWFPTDSLSELVNDFPNLSQSSLERVLVSDTGSRISTCNLSLSQSSLERVLVSDVPVHVRPPADGMSQSSLERVLVSDRRWRSSASGSLISVAILFGASPGFRRLGF